MTKPNFKTMLFQNKWWFILIAISIIARIILSPVRTGDYVFFLEPWMDFIKTHGYMHSLKFNFYNYSPAYIYILIAITKLGLNPLIAVKLVSIFFEYLAAFYIGKIANLKYKSSSIILASIAIVPLLPTVLLNSSYLNQCDSIYAAFCIISIYYLLTSKQLLSVLFLGIAFSFKMQTAIILPFFFVLMLRSKIKWYYFGIVPSVYFLSLVPAWIYGRSILELLSIYINQSSNYKDLTLNFPNIYIWLDNSYYETLKISGLLLTLIVTLLAGWWLSNKKYIFTLENYVKLAFLSAIVIPYILPGMHERYMYLGDIIGVLYILTIRKNYHLPIGIALVSFYSYTRCSRFNDILPMWPAFLIYTCIIIWASYDFVKSLKNTMNETIE